MSECYVCYVLSITVNNQKFANVEGRGHGLVAHLLFMPSFRIVMACV